MYRINHIIASLAVVAVLTLSLNGCKEVPPKVNLTNGNHNTVLDTTYVESPPQAPATKKVVIEMFTGIQCINCPSAHDIINSLIAAHPGRIIEVAMHTLKANISLDDSLPDTRQMLGNQESEDIVNAFGDLNFRPIGSVDRTNHVNILGNPSIYDDRTNWGGYTNDELAVASPVNIVLSKTYAEATQTLTVDVELHYTTAQTDSDKLSIFLTEDSIVTSQLLANNSDDPNYVHSGILRATVTDKLGDNINTSIVAGTVVRKIYTFTKFKPIWRTGQMNIVAFVHRYQNGATNILQSESIKLK